MHSTGFHNWNIIVTGESITMRCETQKLCKFLTRGFFREETKSENEELIELGSEDSSDHEPTQLDGRRRLRKRKRR